MSYARRPSSHVAAAPPRGPRDGLTDPRHADPRHADPRHADVLLLSLLRPRMSTQNRMHVMGECPHGFPNTCVVDFWSDYCQPFTRWRSIWSSNCASKVRAGTGPTSGDFRGSWTFSGAALMHLSSEGSCRKPDEVLKTVTDEHHPVDWPRRRFVAGFGHIGFRQTVLITF